MKITATSEKNAQKIGEWTETYSGNTNWYSKLRLVGWIAQNTATGKTTFYRKWVRDQFNYYPYNNDKQTYTTVFAGTTKTDSFNLPLVQNNGVYDLTAKQSFVVTQTDGVAYTGTLNVSGFKALSGEFSEQISIEFPAMNIVTPDPEDEDEPSAEPPAEIPYDGSPYFTAYVDGELLYMAGLKERYIQSPKLTIEVNKAGSFEFTIHPTSEMYSKIKLLKSTVDVKKGNKIIWRGRPVDPKRDLRMNRKWYCEGFLSWLADRQLLPYTYTNIKAKDLCKEFLTRYNSRATDDRKIVYKYSDNASVVSVEQKNDSDAWTEFKKVIIDGVGGVIIPYLTANETGIQFLSAGGKISSQVVEFGKNLIDYEDHIDTSAIFTAVRPYGKETETNGVKTRLGLTGSSFVVDNDAIARYGRIERTVVFDDITDETKLRAAATAFLATGTQEALSIEVEAVDLQLLGVDTDEIEVGDYVEIRSRPHELDAFFLCSKIIYYLEQPEKNRYTFGGLAKTISEQVKPDSDTQYVIAR